MKENEQPKKSKHPTTCSAEKDEPEDKIVEAQQKKAKNAKINNKRAG